MKAIPIDHYPQEMANAFINGITFVNDVRAVDENQLAILMKNAVLCRTGYEVKSLSKQATQVDVIPFCYVASCLFTRMMTPHPPPSTKSHPAEFWRTCRSSVIQNELQPLQLARTVNQLWC